MDDDEFIDLDEECLMNTPTGDSTGGYWGLDWDTPSYNPKQCECGAASTRDPDCHAHWCPLYEEP